MLCLLCVVLSNLIAGSGSAVPLEAGRKVQYICLLGCECEQSALPL